MLQISYTWLETVIDVSIKSLLLGVAAAVALGVLRVRDSNVCHRVWTAVLAGMLAMPLLVVVTPSVPLPGWLAVSLEPPPPVEHRAELAPPKPPAQIEAPGVAISPDPLTRPAPTAQAAAPPLEALPNAADFLPDSQHIQFEIESPLAAGPSHAVASEPAVPSPSHVEQAARASQPAPPSWLATNWALVLAAACLAASAALLLRFVAGLLLTFRLVRQSRPVDPDVWAGVGRIANPSHAEQRIANPSYARARLLEHPQVYVPLTFGCLRPAVLLPAVWRSWSGEKLQAVLAHELAHVRRRDWFVCALAELNRAIYWFHPLAWLLKKRLSALAEQSCDDAVLETHADRAEYARYLLEVASSLAASGRRCRAPLSSVAMARIPSVETRIDAILDSGRPLAKRLSAIGVVLLLAVGIPAIILAAALRPTDGEAEPTPQGAGSSDAGPKETTENSESPSEEQSESLRHVSGRVVGPDGQPVAGAKVVATTVLMGGQPSYPEFAHQPLGQTVSDEQGRFELEFSLDYAGRAVLESKFKLDFYDWRRGDGGLQIVAHADGYGPAWAHGEQLEKLQEADSPSLQLTEDAPIEGRIVDLEGNPLPGIRVRLRELQPSRGEQAILDWIREAVEKPQPQTLQDYFFRSDDRYPSAFPRNPNDGGLAAGSPALPPEVLTDEQGQFSCDGLGANCLAVLEVEGPNVTKSVLHVVTRDMEPVSARKLMAIGVHTPVHYGRTFEFVALPSQPIEGTVTDAETGEPLADVLVQLQRFAENTFSQDGYLTTRTDEEGHYSLEGAPQGGGHVLAVKPELDDPYFETEVDVPQATSFEPIACDVRLRKGVWIQGKVSERDTGAPIAAATVQYLPLRANQHAEDYANYDPRITGSVPDERFRTSEDGSFRVLAIPGGGVLSAIAQGEDAHRFINMSAEDVPEDVLDENGRLNAYHPWSIQGYHALAVVEIPDSANEFDHDLHVTRGLTRRVHLVDPNGQPMEGVRVLGRTFPPRLEYPELESPHVVIVGLRPNVDRFVAFIHTERKLGKAMTIEAGDETTVQLDNCAVVKGRIVDADGMPVSDLGVRVSVDLSDDWGRMLEGATTGDDGRFEVLLPPGAHYRVWHYSRQDGQNFSAECAPQSGDVIDLGDVTHGIELKVEDTAKLTIARQAADGKPSGERTQTAASRAGGTPALQALLVYEGQVVTPDGKPAAGAELHLVYWYSHSDSSAAHNPVAKTDADGRFRFEMSRNDFHRTGDSVPPWQWASLVAVAEGHGIAWAPSLAFEKTGAVLDEMRESGHPTAADPARLRELIDGPQGRLRLAADELPIHGRVVDTEGQPIAGALVRVVEVYQGQDGTLDAWIEAAGEPRADFYSVRQTVPSHLYGPLAEKLFAPLETDERGRFTIGGIGRERLVRLVIEAPHSEWADVYCRTRVGEALAIGSGMPGQMIKVHGPEFSHVAAPSKPVVGVVTDAQSGEPIGGVVVNSRETWTSTAPGKTARGGNDFSRAVTDDEGRYELLGLPRSPRNHVEFIPQAGAAYLRRMSQVDTQGTDVKPVTLDAELERGLVVAGRVVEAETGRGVSGRLTYLAATDKAGAGTLPALPMWSSQLNDERSDVDGHFEVVVPRGRAYLAFTAFSDIYEKNAARPEDASPPSPYYYAVGAGPEFHSIAKLDPADRVDRVRVEMDVTRGRVVTGTIVDADGNALDGGQYLGRSDSSRWRPVANGEFVVNNYDPARPRRLAFVHREKGLAGTRVLEGELNDDLLVTLKPWGTVTGRVVNNEGDPIAGLLITAGSMRRTMRAMPSPAAGVRADIDQIMPLPPAGDDPNARHLTDDDGGFRIVGLVPGETYELSGFEQAGFEARQSGDIATDVVVESGQTLDLGDVTLQQPDFEALQREAEKQAEEARKAVAPQENANQPTTTNAAPSTPAPTVGADQNAEPATIQIAGQVLAPNGEPFAGARLYWPRTRTPEPMRLDDMYLQQVAASEGDGSFTAELVFPTTPWTHKAPLFAVADGYGMAWIDVSPSQTEENATLQLAEEFPIKGRILTTEGDPLPGAQIGLYSVMADSSGTIHDLLTAWKSEWRSASMRVDKVLHIGLHLVGEILGNERADDQGRFTIRGLGKEQAVWFTVNAPSIAKSTAIVITREDFEPGPYNDAALAQAGNMSLQRRQTPRLYANDLTIVAEAGKIIAGRVTDLESGQPLAGVLVDTSIGYGDAIMATTDDNGEYRLSGIPLFDDEILISFRKPHTRYLPRTLATRLSPGLAPMEFDAGLAKGVVLRGRVTETETGKPVAGGIRFAPLEDNTWQDKPGYDNYKRSRVMENVDQDGNFEFISIPGPGVLLMQAGRSGIEIGGRYVKPYRKGRFSEQDRAKVRIYVEGESFYTSSNGLEFFENGMKVVEIPEDVEEYTANLTVDRGMDVDVAIVDDQNEPLSGAMVCGVTESWPITYTIDEPRCTIYALDPERPRQVIFYHAGRKLAAILTLRGDEEQTTVARLMPTGTLIGRAVDADGQPLAAADVSLSWRDDTAREFQRQLDMTHEVAATDDDGRFRLEGVFPGVYRLRFQQGEKRFRTDSLLEDATTVLAAAAGVGGREIQLGDVVVRPQ